MSGIQKSFSDVVADFNLSAQTEFNKQYEMLEPAFKNAAFRFNAGAVANSKFFINMLFGDVKEWKGTQEYRSVDKIISQQINHVEYFAEGIPIPIREFKRAMAANSITGLDMYIKNIGSLAPRAKDAPYELMIDYLEAGEASTYGTCFDNQNFFDTTHSFNDTAGTQSNLVTGTGISLAQLSADLKTAISELKGYYFETDTGNTATKKRRLLNKGQMKLVVVAPSDLYAKLMDLRTLELIVVDSNGGTQSNSLRNSFELVAHPFADANDWYVMELSESTVKPFLISVEDEGSLHTPQENSEALVNLQQLRYAFNGLSYGVAYGAWWKAIKVKNS